MFVGMTVNAGRAHEFLQGSFIDEDGDYYEYYAHEIQQYVTVDADDLEALSEALDDDADGTAYSRWCAETHCKASSLSHAQREVYETIKATRPDLCADLSAIAACVVAAGPKATAAEIIEGLDEATADWALERAYQASLDNED